MLAYKKAKQTIEPKLYMIALHAQANGDVLIYNTAVAAFTIETAKSEALLILKEANPPLHANGIALGGWKVQNHIELTPIKIDEMLATAYAERGDIEDEKERQERNDLMTTIVETASRKLLNKHKDLFTTAEVAYLEDEIEKYERAK